TVIGDGATDATAGFWFGLLGPFSGGIIGLLSLAFASVTGWKRSATPSDPFVAGIVWLGCINLTLAVFDMIPGFPLDGGRVMRGLIWWITGDAVRAMKITAKLGQFIAGCFIILGIMSFFGGS